MSVSSIAIIIGLIVGVCWTRGLHHRGLHAPEFKPNEDKSYRDVGWRVHLDHRPSSGNGSGDRRLALYSRLS